MSTTKWMLMSIYILFFGYNLIFNPEDKRLWNALKMLYEVHNEDLKFHPVNQTQTLLQNAMQRDFKKLIHPDTVLEDIYIYRTNAYGDTIRDYIRKQGFDSQPLQEQFQTKPMTTNQNLTASEYTSLHFVPWSHVRSLQYATIGLLERFMHFPVPTALCDKVTIAVLMHKWMNKLKSQGKSQQCLRDAQFQKWNYILDNPEQCKAFFKKANQEYNVSHEVYNYVKKNNRHNQVGTELAFQAVYKQVAEMYDYGRNCTQPPRTLIMQEYIKNPLLIDGRKFDIRLHMMVVSTNPLIVYIYKTFYLMKCAYPFSYTEFKNQSHICSAGYQRKLIEMLKAENNTEELKKILPADQITEAVSYEEFADKLIKEGKVKDRSWVDSYMIPEMEKRFYHYFMSYFDDAGQIATPRVGEYNACEFDIDDKLNFWLLECTTNPNMIPTPQATVMRKFQQNLHKDGMAILVDYTRAKYQRIRNFIMNEMNKIKNLDEMKKVIKDVLADRVISKPSQGFHLINMERARESCK